MRGAEKALVCPVTRLACPYGLRSNTPARIRDLEAALEGMLVMHDELCKKINFEASALNADVIRRMNEAPYQARAILEARG